MEDTLVHYYKPLLGYINKRVNNTLDAEDLLQDIFLKLSQSDLEKIDNLKSWLYAVARNAIIDYYRKKKIELIELEQQFSAESMDDESTVYELSKCVQTFIEYLPGDYAQLLKLHETSSTLHEGPISVMGPGTGFGLALVLIGRTTVTVAPTEGGHASFVPHGESESAVFQEVFKSMGRVTVETFMSGIGILRIYSAVCSLRGIQPRNYEPSTISQQALENGDDACVETLRVFCSMLGGVAADIALTQGAVGGVYLGGGILPKIGSFLQSSNFMDRFLDKPPMNDYVAGVPVSVITDPTAALIGASLLAIDT